MRKAHAFRRARLRGLALAGGLAAGPVLAGLAPASAQGLFESLFGGGFFQPAPPRIYAPPPQAIPDFRRDTRRATPKRIVREPRHDRPRAEALTKPGPYVAPQVLPGPLGRFLRDATLRRGDVVATSQGLMVFRGGQGARHSEKDFVPLAKAGSLVRGSAKTELAKLNGAVRAETDAQLATAEKSPPIVAQDEGRRLR